MEMKNLTGFVLLLIFVSMITGVGILVFDKFGNAVKNPTTINESVVIAGGIGTLANDEVTAFTFFGNTTVNTTDANININEEVNWTAAGGLIVNTGNFSNGTYTATYTYKADSTTTTQLTNSTNALAEIPSTWLVLLVTIVILGIIMGVVIKSFSGKGR